jgi:putative ABC transport system permease protein
MNELRRALRSLRRAPGFSLVAILTLALGTGANTAVFSVVQAVLLRPLPFPEADRLVRIRLQPRAATHGEGEASFSQYDTLRREAPAGTELGAWATSSGRVVVDAGDGPEMLRGYMVTGTLPRVLGLAPVAGRLWREEDDRPGAAPTALISEGLWRGRFGADPQIVGRLIKVDGTPVEVVGVLPAGTAFPAGAEVWTPLGAVLPEALLQSGAAYLNLVGRMPPGRTDLGKALDAVLEQSVNPQLPPNGQLRTDLVPFADALFGNSRAALLLLLGAAFLVLLVACANVANLQLVRGVARGQDLAVRRALGAGTGDLARTVMAETLVLGALGGGAGLLAAAWGVKALSARNPDLLFRADTIGMNPAALLMSLGAAFLTLGAFALVPVVQSLRLRLPEALHGGGRATLGPRGRRLLDAFVVAQVTLALVLCVGASLLLHSLERLRAVDPGFGEARVVTLGVPLLDARYQDPEASDRFFEQLVADAEALPGVERAAGVLLRPLDSPDGFDAPFTAFGQADEEQRSNPILSLEAVTPGYFEAMGISLAEGRDVAPTDGAAAPPVAVVSRAMAARLWPGRSALGQRFKLGGVLSKQPWIEVVGVAGDVRSRALETSRLEVYVPFRQSPWGLQHLVVRTQLDDPARLVSAVRDAMRRIDPGVEPVDVLTTRALLDRALARPRFQSFLVGLFAALGLAIGGVGLFGVLAYTLAVRTREMGVRLALGAPRSHLVGLALRRGLLLSAAGTAVGLLVSAGVTRAMQGLLFGVAPFDPLAFGGSALVLLAVALAASLGPAWRVSRVNPVVALRSE